MRKRNYRLHDGKKGAALAIRVTPRSSRNWIVGVMDDGTVKVNLTAPPAEGKANEALIKLLADALDIAPSKLEIIAGATGREKLISILDLTADEVNDKIREAIG